MVKVSRGDSKTSRHIEVELKFDVPDTVTSTPSFDGIDAVATVRREPALTLTAVYFDTPGRDLAARRIALRRRTGGHDAGWHLKLPGDESRRTEIHADLGGGGDDQVPDALRDIVLAIVRDRPLLPVAWITNHRTVDVLFGSDGNALAEFCDDRVIASTEEAGSEQRWREWELELAEGAIERGNADSRLLARLRKRLRAAGAAPSKHASKLMRTLGPSAGVFQPILGSGCPERRELDEQLESLLVWDRAVRADEEDAVHQMRVAVRAIRSLLQSLPASFGLTKESALLGELRELADTLGAARDAEVLADRYRRALDGLPGDLVRGPIRQRLVDGGREHYRAELSKSVRAMRSQRYFRLLDGLEALLLTDPDGSALTKSKRRARVAIHRGYRRVNEHAKTAAAADADHRDAELHAVRKSAKRLRYLAAAAGAKRVARAAKAVQSLLGDHHDSVVSRCHLLEQAGRAYLAGEDTFTYGLLYEREAAHARNSEQQLPGALRSLHKAVKDIG